MATSRSGRTITLDRRTLLASLLTLASTATKAREAQSQELRLSEAQPFSWDLLKARALAVH